MLKVLSGGFAAGLALLAVPAITIAQDSTPSDSVARPDPIAAYLRAKSAEFSASERGVGAIARNGEYTALYNLLRDKGPFRATAVQGDSEADRALVRDALVRTVAYYLAGTGMTPAAANALTRDGLDPLAAGAKVVGGLPSLNDYLIVAQIAARAKVISNTASDAQGLERRVELQLTEMLKGDTAKAAGNLSNVVLEMQIGMPLAAAQPGQEYLVFLSTDYARYRAAAGFGRRIADPVVQQAAPFEIEGDSIRATMPGQILGDPPSWSAVQKFAADHAASFK